MITHLGPEARLAEAAGDLRDGLARLPRLLENLDRGAAELANGRIRLHPETIRALEGGNRFSVGPLTLAIAAAVLAVFVALALS